MTDSWDNNADTWDTNEAVVLYADKAYASLTGSVNIEARRVLDFGCGTGLLAERMSPAASHILAMDTSEKMADVLRSKKLPNVTTLTAPLDRELIACSSLFEHKFDIVVASSVLNFVPDYQSAAKLLYSILLSGGVLVQWDWLASDAGSEFGLSKSTVSTVLESAGFVDIDIASPFCIASEKGDMPVLMAVGKKK